MGEHSLSETTSDYASPNTDLPEEDIWQPLTSDIKTYRHFDAPLSISDIIKLVRDKEKVAAHKFFPLLEFKKIFRKAPKNGVAQNPKIRPIKYACRKDAYIYKHYREKLSQLYEKKLDAAALEHSVLAYRRIPIKAGEMSCKSNINFAHDAFKQITQMGKCCAVALDISDYFGSINHERLKLCWSDLIRKNWLPEDHFSVLNSVTNYRYVEIDDAFVALGYSRRDRNGKISFCVKPSTIPIQLCTNSEYREKIVRRSLVRKNPNDYGIPQGTPISDILANLYLFEFDLIMKKYAVSKGGVYYRYSDDILLIIPGDGRAAYAAAKKATVEIKKCGQELKIKPEKTEIVCYTGRQGQKRCYTLKQDKSGGKLLQMSFNEGLPYLGFRFDGHKVYLRNSTLTNLRGKIVRTCKAEAFRHVKRHTEKNLDWLLERTPLGEIKQKFLRVEDFEDIWDLSKKAGKSPFASMTFWSYAKRAEEVFGRSGSPIMKQIRGINSLIDETLEKEIRSKYLLVHHYQS